MHNKRSASRTHSQGVTLIETLVTVLVLSVGLLGLAGMHMQGLKNNQSAYFRSQATIMAYSIVESMRANKQSAVDKEYDIALNVIPDDTSSIAKTDLTNWKNELSAILPSGDGIIDCTTNKPICSIIVQWDDSLGAGGESSQQFTVATQL